jgi:phenylpropionate dioxygenase-like ring-hydroxylating dioxygenase large terminal subunit
MRTTRTTVKRRTLFAFMATGAALLAAAQSADAAHKAVVRAFAYHPVPADAAIAVVPWDDSDENLRIKAAFQSVLQDRGHTLDAEGELWLRFEVRVRRLGPEPSEPRLGSVAGGSGSGVTARFNVWSSTEDSLLTGQHGKTGSRAAVLQLVAILQERGGERRVLWRGEAQTELGNMGRAEAAMRVVPVLSARLGEKLTATTVTLAP